MFQKNIFNKHVQTTIAEMQMILTLTVHCFGKYVPIQVSDPSLFIIWWHHMVND